ncbi:hypothetical protein [Neorhizobium galegae]|uniref:hypothetical protein n=1 Tax=Neorhizobium galegae TaxID=399 RepID=UPI001F38396E|nr:hypothetical protein [Neorhizobium galegae]UIK08730.1 hypothetical protein LZK81_24915 [Neorhizobium galegae]
MVIERERRTLVIVERKLAQNRGHYHTQITALRTMLPNYETALITGEAYDGFLGISAATLATSSLKGQKLRSRLRHGNPLERVGALLALLRKGLMFNMPVSAYGRQFAEVVTNLKLDQSDLIIVPTADLDTLESSVDLHHILGDAAPRVILRFLNAELGDRNDGVRSARLREVQAKLPKRVLLFTETEELADHLRKEFNIPVAGGFYLPCSVPIADSPEERVLNGRFRIGVFGEPRLEKGSSRIPGITTALAQKAAAGSAGPFEIVVQGAAADFQKHGVYEALAEHQASGRAVVVSPHDNRLSPQEFARLFASVDAILLPYDTSLYNLQGSGVIQDAVAARKPIIYTKGMSMMSFLDHGNGLAAETDQDFAEAIMRVASDPLTFREGTARAAAYLQNAIAASPFLRAINAAQQ